jgi:hypothetical protein
MTITKCDICKKMIKKEQLELSLSFIGGHPVFVHHTICMDSGKPIMPFIKKHHLDEDKRSRSRTTHRAA